MRGVTKTRVCLFVALLVVSFSPIVLFGSGPAIILPVVLVFWLAGLAQAMGVTVASNGVDAFNLVPPTLIGGILIVVGFGLSLAVYYWLAGMLAAVFSRSR